MMLHVPTVYFFVMGKLEEKHDLIKEEKQEAKLAGNYDRRILSYVFS